MTIGVYKLNFIGTPKVYIGKSIHIEIRFREHLYKLRRNKGATKLQEAFNMYGEPTYEILSVCNENNLINEEKLYILQFNAINNGFNTLEADTNSSLNRLKGEKHPLSKYKDLDIINAMFYILENPDVGIRKISILLSINYSVLKHIIEGTLHNWLKELYPIEYTELTNRSNSRNNDAKSLGISYPDIQSPTGEIYSNISNLTHFAKEHGLNTGCLCNVMKGKRGSHKGWVLK